MNNIKNVPEIRFKGCYDEDGNWIAFTHPWEQRKVSELADETYGGGTPKTSIEEYWNGTIPWIQSSDITEHDVNTINPKKFISEDGVGKSATKLVPKNSIAIVTRVGVGKLVIMPFSYATSQDFLSLSKLNSDVSFAAYLLYKKMQNESHAVQGTSIKGITKEELLCKEVMIPQLEEQKKIGTYFQSLDNLITLHQRKAALHETYVKSVEQKLMSCEIRFKADDGSNFPDWEKRNIGELVTEYTEKTIQNNQFEVLSSTHNGIKFQKDYFNKKTASADTTGYKVVPRGYFTYRAMSDNDVFVFNRQMIIDKGIVSPAYPVFDVIGADKTFFEYYINSTDEIRKQLMTLKEGGTRYALSFSKFCAMHITIPSSLAEQQKIADCLSAGYAVVEQDKMVVDVLKKFKKCMLQKMFV